MKRELSIIIVSYNTKKLTLGCVASIFKLKPKINYEIIVVDNGSTDGTVEALKEKYPKAKIIKNKENRGFAKANNQGIRASTGDYILLLNSDTKVKTDAIDIVVEFAKSIPNAGAVVPKLLNSDGTTQASVFRFPTIMRAIRQYWLGEAKILDKYAPRENIPSQVEVAVMAAFLITPQARKKVGLLDEKYFMFFEDFDYCRRIKSAEMKVYYVPEAEVIHCHGASGKGLVDKGSSEWRRLIPSSKIYHGLIGHYIFNSILWSGQKLR